jgi:hypothetical protein
MGDVKMRQFSWVLALLGSFLIPGTGLRADEAADSQAAADAIHRMGGTITPDKDKTRVKIEFGCHAKINPADFTRVKGLKNIEEFEAIVPLRDAQLEDLRDQAGLRKLSLNAQLVTDAGLAHLKTLSGLRELGLRRSAYTAEGLCDLAKGLEKLEKLGFSQRGVGDDGLKCLGGLPALRELWLEDVPVSDQGMVHLAGAKKLRSLSFYQVAISDEGLQQLQGLAELEELYIGKAAVTDAGLALLKSLPKLRLLTITACPVTDAGLRDLKAGLPALEIRRQS